VPATGSLSTVDRLGMPARMREPIAIVGLGCRFPGGADSPARFWQNLLAGVNGVREIPPERWSLEGFFDPRPGTPGRSATKWGGFVDQIDHFDAGFFGISPREAAEMDPQQRLLLMVAWEALEDAGIAADRLRGAPVGVFVGVSINDYAILQKHHPTTDSIHAGTGTALSIVANRISHRLDLQGPSVSVDTACSSSIVALDLACRSLWDGDCELALSGGVNALLEPGGFLYFSSAGMMSTDGRVHAFDADGTGFVRAEGAGVVVLKTLAAAEAAGDRVYAVIHATTVNQDGNTPTLTGPSQAAQTAMLQQVCLKAGIAPEQVAYVEAHGTGTPVGDPIEAGAIGNVFGKARRSIGRLPIGSVKTQTGHLESAAGIAGLIKTTLALHHRTLPPNLNFASPNPAIPFDELNIEVVTAPRPLDEPLPIAVVNSFGFGGTNACALLQAAPLRAAAEPPAAEPPAAEPPALVSTWPSLVPLSAATATALRTRAAEVASALREGTAPPSLAAVAGTLALRRAQLAHRVAVVASSTEQLAERLEAFAAGRPAPGVEEGAPAVTIAGRSDAPAPVAFVFAGQGGQSWRMARTLLTEDPVFRAEVDAFDAIFRGVAGWSIIDELMADEACSRIDSTAVTQPAIFAVQIGLVARWRAMGIVPDLVVGHSFGEVAAAYTAGALSLEDAVQIIYHRGRLQDETQGAGTMAAVAMAAGEVRARLAELGEEAVEIAADNGPQMVTLAGDTTALQRFIAGLQEADPELFCRILKVDYAAHSRQMESIRDAFVSSLAGLRPRPPVLPMISTVTGQTVGAEPLDADYWYDNVRRPVLFQDALAAALATEAGTFVEIGPHATLSGIIAGNLAQAGKRALVVPSLHAKHGDVDQLYASLAALWVQGVPVRWETLVDPAQPRVALPAYPWELQRFWADSEESRAAYFPAPAHPLLGTRSRGAEPVWTNEISLRSHPFIADHRVDGAALFPGAGYVELVLAAGREVLGEGPLELEDVTFRDALFMQDEQSVQLQTVLEPERDHVRIYSRVRDGGPEWTLRASARVRLGASTVTPFAPFTLDSTPVARDAFYAHAEAQGHQYGPCFQGLVAVQGGQGAALGTVEVPAALDGGLERYVLHPAILDACLQVGFGMHPIGGAGEAGPGVIMLPTAVQRLRVLRPVQGRLKVGLRVVREDARSAACDIVATDETRAVVVVLDGFTSRKLPSQTARTTGAAAIAAYQEFWQEAALELQQPGKVDGTWLVLGDADQATEALGQALAAGGASVIEALSGETFVPGADGTWRLRPDSADDMQQLIDRVIAAHPDLAGVVHLWGLAHDTAPSLDGAALLATQGRRVLSALHLVQALARHEAAAPRVYLATRGAHRLPGEPATADDALATARLMQAPLVGFARSAANEQPQLRLTVVDLDPLSPANGEGAAADLMVEIAADSPELEVAIRGSTRYVNRVDAVALEALPRRRVPAVVSDGCDYRLTMTAPGVFDNMLVTETPALHPAPDEVVIAVEAVGINFHDILSAAGMMPEGSEDIDAWEFLGLECAGVVREVGREVTDLGPGDRVMSPGKGCLGSAVRVKASAVQRLPDGIGFVDGATVPTAFMTAHYALNHLGRMAKGETVLIHVATGGVGLAAIQLARAAGSEIFATAGSEAKRDYLRRLGITHVMNSRTLDFADEVMAATGGRGVDIVLNSLPGAFIDKGLAILAPYGRFLEMGKRDLFADKPIGLRALRNSNAFLTVDLDGLAHDRPAELARVFAEVAAMLAEGRIRPLPAERFPLTAVADAFHHMSKARHIGKVVVTVTDPGLEMALDPERPLALAADGAYLVTGGLGGFGLEVARWLARHGAGQLVLMSRSGASTDEAKATVAELEADGTVVTIVAGDVTEPADVERAVAAAVAAGRRLRGVVHAAMVLDDGFVTQLDDARFATALKPKMLGGWNLHRATAGEPLDFFLLFSSVAALLGSTGQANYVAGNAFLEKLAAHRRAAGVPALAVAWGALGGQGFVARNEAIARYLESQGIAPVEPADALAWLGRTLRLDPVALAVARIDWQKLGQAQGAVAASPRVAHLLSAKEGRASGGRMRAEILAAPAARRPILTAKFLKAQVARVLRVEPAEIEDDRPLNELGLDSLTSFELKNRIESELAVSLPASKFLQKPTIAALAEAILEKLGEAAAEETAAAEAAAETAMPLTPWQEWLCALERLAPAGEALRINNQLAFAVGLKPGVDTARLAAAFTTTLEAHPGLRSRILPGPDGPILEIMERHPDGLVLVEERSLDDAAFAALLTAKHEAPYDFERGPLVRLEVIRRADDHDVVFLAAHHAVVDAWSLILLVSELFAIYFGAGDQQSLSDAEPGFDAIEYARWLRRFMSSPEGQEQRAYWLEQLRDPGPALPLPYDRQPPVGGRLAMRVGKGLQRVMSEADSRATKALAADLGTSRYVVMLAAFKLLLHHYTGRADLLVTGTAAARTRPELERVIGSLYNFVFFRSALAPAASFREFVEQVDGLVANGLANQDYPTYDLFDEVEPGHLGKRTALEQVAFQMLRPENLDDRGFGSILLNEGGAKMQFGTLEIETLSFERRGCLRELTVYHIEHDDRIHLSIKYDADLFDAATAARILDDYQAMLRACIARPDARLAELAAALTPHVDVVPGED
jgi:acyl transferase domain-containing protein/acyl carrier protein